jgi:hypothetical protein
LRRAGEGGNGDDRVERGSLETLHELRELLLVEHLAVVAVSRGWDLLGAVDRVGPNSPLAYRGAKAGVQHRMDVVPSALCHDHLELLV